MRVAELAKLGFDRLTEMLGDPALPLHLLGPVIAARIRVRNRERHPDVYGERVIVVPAEGVEILPVSLEPPDTRGAP